MSPSMDSIDASKRSSETSESVDLPVSKRQRLECPVSTTPLIPYPQSLAEASLSTTSISEASKTPDPTSPKPSTLGPAQLEPSFTVSATSDGTKSTASKKRSKPKPIVHRIVTTETPHPVEGEYIVQEGLCRSYQRKDKDFPMCMACITRQYTSGGCKFMSLRAFPSQTKIIQSYTPMFVDSAPFLGKKQREANCRTSVSYSTSGDSSDAEFVRGCIAPTFASVLAMELDHETVYKEALVRRLREAGVRPVCDGCATTIFSGHFMCCACGKEICLDCYAQWDDTLENAWGDVDCCSRKRRHTKKQMVPFTYFQPGESEKLILEVNGYRRAQNLVQHEGEDFAKSKEHGYLPYVKVNVDEIEEADFKRLWDLGQPIVLTGCSPRFQIPWTPEHFMEQYGQDRCMLVNCNSDKTINTTVGKFFAEFLSNEPKRPLKLKDWPPADDFAQIFPELFEDFENALPFPRYTRRKGFMNLASRFPEDLVTPDLGPKMYNAHASSDALDGPGTTKLHLDITDAVNIMTFAAESEITKERGGAAVWDIFPAEATDTLRNFLRTTSSKNVDDPVLRQTFYISTPQLEQLRDEYGIVPWRIYQNLGDAVFIPAGCAHQVCNLTSCIKVACDFVSPHCIRRCKDLIDWNRGLAGIKGGKREDVLQLKTMMMCAWDEITRWNKLNCRSDIMQENTPSEELIS